MSELTLIQLCVITVSCSIIPRGILSVMKIAEMLSNIKKEIFSPEGKGSILKEFCKQELVLIFLSISSLILVSQLETLDPGYYTILPDEFKVLTLLVLGSWCLFELILTLKLYQKLDTITIPKNALLSVMEQSVTPAMKMAMKVQGGPKKAVIRAAKMGVVKITQKKLSENEDAEPSAASNIALKAVNVAETILTLPEKIIDKGMELTKKYQESKAKKLETYPERSVKTTLLLICWSILPVAYIVLLSYAL
jgi:hypothetical protein